MHLKVIMWEGVDWLNLAQDTVRLWGVGEYSSYTLGSIKKREFFD